MPRAPTEVVDSMPFGPAILGDSMIESTRRVRSGARMLLALALAFALEAPAVGQRPTYIAVVGDGAAAAREGQAVPWPGRFHPFKQIDMPTVTNLAATGLSPAQASAVLARHDADESVDVVVAHFGVDAARRAEVGGPETFAVQLRELVASVRNRNENTGIVLVTPTPLQGGQSNEPYANAVRNLAAELRLPLVDLHGIFARRDRFAGHAAADWLAGDYPNDAGQIVIQHLVARAIACGENFVPGARHTTRPEYAPAETWQGRPDYSIPVLDLSGQTARQVVVDREAGQYLGHPTTVLLEDGRTLIVVYPQGHGRGAIVMKRSSDGGATFGDRLRTPASWATSLEVPTIHRLVDPAGIKRLVLFSGLYPIRMSVSEDDGLQWSELAPIGDFGGIVAMGTVIETRTPGRYLALFHDDGRFLVAEPKPSEIPHWTQFHVYQTESLDGGLTWGAPRAITDSGWQHCEPGSIRSPDGGTLAVLLRENSRFGNSHVIFSTDEGATWSAPRPLPAALTGDRHTARFAPDGRLFVTFRDRTLVSPTEGDWVAWVGTWEDLVSGAEGQYRVRLMDNQGGSDCAYPGLELLPDGTFVTTTYGHWTADEAPYIVSVRLRLAELDALAEDPQELR
jgi:BNR repeat-like domain/GDSL-like Lipase/Acylhydrolase family